VSVPDVILRQIIFDAIDEKRRLNQFLINDFEIEQTYFPWQRLEDVPEAGKVWVISLAADDKLLTRADTFERDIPIQIGLQHKLKGAKPGDMTLEIDRYRELEDQLRDACRLATKDHSHFDWRRTEALKDESGMPYSFTGMRQNSTFEAYFVAYYHVVLK
jgi:hypothetical protein